jgi:hypothetical protein
MYTDGVVEGTPEEIAAYKHIDAALGQRETRTLKALPAPRPKRPPSARGRSREIREWAWTQGFAVARRGAIPVDVIQAFDYAHRRRSA